MNGSAIPGLNAMDRENRDRYTITAWFYKHAKNTPGLVATGTRFVRHDTYLPIEGLRKT